MILYQSGFFGLGGFSCRTILVMNGNVPHCLRNPHDGTTLR
jgi:hypothetical protein